MEIIIRDTPADVATLVASHICDVVRETPRTVLGLATGKTPVRTYLEVTDMAARNGINFADVRIVMLDEYLGLSDEHPGLFRNVLLQVMGGLGIEPGQLVALPNHWPDHDPDVELSRQCREFERRIKHYGGVDLQLLGISELGHIGFNEPTSSLASRTRVKTLTKQTRTVNADAFANVEITGIDMANLEVRVDDDVDNVPDHVVTQGIATILESKHAILIATGKEKAAIVARAVEGPVSAFVPASALQLHPHATVVIDEDAATDLAMADYYREIQRNKRYVQRPIT